MQVGDYLLLFQLGGVDLCLFRVYLMLFRFFLCYFKVLVFIFSYGACLFPEHILGDILDCTCCESGPYLELLIVDGL